MPGKQHHELIFRGEDVMQRLAETHIVVCGAGAVGSNLVETLARQGAATITVIDKDRVEEHNISTQVWLEEDVGAKKVDALKNRVYDATGSEIEGVGRTLEQANVKKLLADADLVVDGFDNHASRALVSEHCRAAALPCLHVGLAADYAEVLWNEGYTVPRDPPDGPDVCDYPMARNLITLAVSLAAEVIVRFVADGSREAYTLTLGDLRVNREERDQ
ncbi:MAG: ThiF family adenylyltransferase [Myxococcales bacterium]|nr:ThiF family adenylyltransferase [Myxococcales bacterium]